MTLNRVQKSKKEPASIMNAKATSERTLLRSDFLLHKKISHTRRHSSSFAKRHARLNCSLVNALTTARSRYHLFASVPSAHISIRFTSSKKIGKYICACRLFTYYFFTLHSSLKFYVLIFGK